MAAAKQLLHSSRAALHVPFSSSSSPPLNFNSQVFRTHKCVHCTKLSTTSSGRFLSIAPNRASSQSDGIIEADIDGGGVPLGTMKLPPDTDVNRFETLLFQWANSLCQGANLPLPVPLKVDRIKGGARLGFITIEDAKTEVCVYIDCLVFPATKDSSPMFRAVRNGTMKDQPPPGEPRIMRSLLQALQKSVEIARI
ncbi:Plant organelle RNA recognition domain-containing protein [Cinnamomum micranthum f. kanehirae]|uniref:Plant organelle RNA recognition domain-containing protein n=1 Tax=Cinnamomum micranthum f. kanehirae TaxID=337451 RepID=A0A443P329_9MAGN|nr:Plant organelle RNA recognition domain-containing protein [Cinnamomum micranthum f. kanehirae]